MYEVTSRDATRKRDIALFCTCERGSKPIAYLTVYLNSTRGKEERKKGKEKMPPRGGWHPLQRKDDLESPNSSITHYSRDMIIAIGHASLIRRNDQPFCAFPSVPSPEPPYPVVVCATRAIFRQAGRLGSPPPCLSKPNP